MRWGFFSTRNERRNMITCSKCQRTLDEDRFSRDRASSTGRQGTCKECRTAIYKKWSQENPEKVKSIQQSWRERNRNYGKRTFERDKIKKRERAHKHREMYPDKISARLKARYVNIPRIGQCAHCKCDGLVEKHHPDYKKPKYVIPLCKSCHTKIHAESAQHE